MKLGHIMLKESLKHDLQSQELFAVCSAKTTWSLYQDNYLSQRMRHNAILRWAQCYLYTLLFQNSKQIILEFITAFFIINGKYQSGFHGD